MTELTVAGEADFENESRYRLLRIVAISVFVLFCQTYMIAPLIPSLADTFHAQRESVGLLIPAYALPYAFAALICGGIVDRFGRRGLLFFSLTAFPIMSLAMAAAPGLRQLILLRIVSGATNVGIVVSGLSLVGDIFHARERGWAIGWVFGALAGGGAMGSTFGGVLSPIIGWRGLFVLVAIAGVVQLMLAVTLWAHLASPPTRRQTLLHFFTGYATLLRLPRGARTYAYIFLNAIFHSGVFTWLGVLLHDRFGLGDAGIGIALIGYGVPGLFLGPTIGRLVDRYGRRRLIPVGMLVAAASAALLAPAWPIALAALAITVLSLGFDMSHPLFAGIATTLDNQRRGQAMGLNTFSIFLGLGVGSFVFGALAHHGMGYALYFFAIGQAIIGVTAFFLFRNE